MKKIIASAAALVFAGTMAVSVFAQADEQDVTTVQPVGRVAGTDGFDLTPTPAEPDTEVKAVVDPGYIVTIPETVELFGTYGTKYTNTADVSAERVLLESGYALNVAISSASAFNLKTSESAAYSLPYTVSTELWGPVDDKANGGVVAQFGNGEAVQTVELTFETDDVPQYAGSFKDTVTFEISVMRIPND
ncbi:MAG: hypothetical protein IKN17_01095 [Ruminococcus sp.]|nr:hypothetical protein [Ruminococcus sp.]